MVIVDFGVKSGFVDFHISKMYPQFKRLLREQFLISGLIHVKCNWPLPKVQINRKRKVRTTIHYKITNAQTQVIFSAPPGTL